MKFSCERCGKKYATADKPVPGRVYKLKCKACGHLIVVKGAAASASPPDAASTPSRTAPDAGGEARTFERFAPMPAPTPTPAGGVALGATTELSLPRADVSQELAARTPPPERAATPLPFPAPTPVPSPAVIPAAAAEVPPAPELAPPPGDGGYVDLFADAVPASESEADPAPPEDPFLAAARSSLPETFGGESADPFAPIRAELDLAAAGDGAPVADDSPPLAPPKVPDIPRPPPRKQGVPFVLIGAGVLVMIGILVFALTGGKKPGVAAATSAPVAPAPAAAPAPPPAPAPVVEKAPEPVAVAPEPEPAPAPPPPKAEPPPKPARVERPPERQREPSRRAERKVEPRPEPKPEKVVAAAPQPATAPEPPPRQETQVDLPQASEGLSQDQIQRVLASTRKAFDNCIATAGKDSDIALDGRKVALRLNIQPNGSVTYPTLDDVQLNATPLGSCLKSAARLMVFPKFKGDPLRIEVPLTLSGR